MNRKVRKITSLLLTLVFTLGLISGAPQTAKAANLLTAGTEAEFGEALAKVQDGDTVKLTDSFDYHQLVQITGMDVTIDTNGYTLTLMDRIDIFGGGFFMDGTGKVYIKGDGGLSAINRSTAVISGIYTTGEGYYGIYAFNDSSVTVDEDVVLSGELVSYTAVVAGYGSQVIAGGNIESSSFNNDGAYAFNSFDGELQENKTSYIECENITGGNISAYAIQNSSICVRGNIESYGTGAYADSGAAIEIGGSISAAEYGANSYGGFINVGGNICAKSPEDSEFYGSEVGVCAEIGPEMNPAKWAVGKVFVSGNVDSNGYGLRSYGGEIYVGGDVTATRSGIYVSDGYNEYANTCTPGAVEVGGDVICGSGIGVDASYGSFALINGSVTGGYCGVNAWGRACDTGGITEVFVKGNVYTRDQWSSGINAGGGAEITIDGDILMDFEGYEGAFYIVMGDGYVLERGDITEPTTKEGYLTYTLIYDYEEELLVEGTVWVGNGLTPVPAATVTIPGRKLVRGIESTNQSFRFRITQIEFMEDINDIEVIPGGITGTASINGAGSFSFVLNGIKEGYYRFMAEEINGGAAGWTYDRARHIVDVYVSAGYIPEAEAAEAVSSSFDVEIYYPNETQISFTNSYTAPAEETDPPANETTTYTGGYSGTYIPPYYPPVQSQPPVQVITPVVPAEPQAQPEVTPEPERLPEPELVIEPQPEPEAKVNPQTSDGSLSPGTGVMLLILCGAAIYVTSGAGKKQLNNRS